MRTPNSKVNRFLVSGRELFVCDNVIAASSVIALAACVNPLSFARPALVSGAAPSPSSAELPSTPLMAEFIAELQRLAGELFPATPFAVKRACAVHSIHGDVCELQRDSAPVRMLYDANLVWEPDWGGETIYFDDNKDAKVAVSARPGRVIASRGAILQRPGVPTRDCPQARLTIALTLDSAT